MAEKLAQRSSTQTEVLDAQSLDHDAFDDIIANYDKVAADATYGSQDNAPELAPVPELTTDEQASLDALDFTPGESHTTTETAAVTSPAALAPATRPRPTAPVAPVPLTPAPRPLVQPVAPPPVAPSTEVVTMPPLVTTTETTPPPPAPPENVEIPPTDLTNTPPEFKVVMLDQTKDAKEAAKDAADALLTKELNEGGKFKRFMKGIWKGGVLKEYYRQKYTARAENEIREAQDVLIHQESSADARARATKAVLERFGYTQYEETVHEAAGERRNTEQSNSPAAIETKKLIERYVKGELNDETFAEKRSELASKYAGEVAMDNLMEVAQGVKGAIEHGESLDNVLQNMQVITGEVRAGSRTQARHNMTDRVMEKIASTKIGSMIPKTVVAASVGAAACVLRIGAGKVGGVLLTIGTIGISSAVIGALREGKRAKDEQAQHNREMAMGGEIAQSTARQSLGGRIMNKFFPNRREQSEKGRERAVSAEAMTSELQSKLAALESGEIPDGKTREQVLQEAIDALTSANVHNLITDESSKDSNLSRKERRKRAEVIEWEGHAISRETRLKLDIARAQLKVALNSELDDPTRASLAASLNLPSTASLEDLVAHRSVSVVEAIETDIDEKRSVRRKTYMKRMLLVGATTFAVGATIATGAQELRAVVDTSLGMEDHAGVFDSKAAVSADGREHQTLLRGLFRGEHDASHVGPDINNWNHAPVGESHADWAVTGDHHMAPNADGTYNLVDNNGRTTVEHLKVNTDGTMPEETRQLLESKGMRVEDAMTSTTHYEERPVSMQDYMDNHSDKTVKIKHDSWQDNDTRAFDKNEKRIHWTGTGVVPGENGQNSYHLNIANMTEGGSYHKGQHVNWVEEAKKGNLMYTVHPDENSSETFMVPIAADGSIDISPDDPAAKFFVEKDGHAVFTGHAAEINRLNDIDAQGRQHVDTLATMLGNDEAKNSTFMDKVPVTESKPGYKIITNGYDTPGTFTETPPFIPIVSRRPLENLGRRERGNAYYGYNNGYGGSGEYWRRWAEERSPRLQRNPDADLNTGQELSWYRTQQAKLRGKKYANEIDGYVEASDAFKAIDNNTKAVVCIPVAAANEADNIYNTLSMFARQDKDARDSTVIALNINWKESLEKDPAQMANIQKTIAEVERARRDFPDLKIASFEKVWSDEFVRSKKGKIYGEVIKPLYDAAAFAMERAVREGRRDASTEAVLITNDADTLGMSRHYLRNYIDALENNPKKDVFSGMIRRGVKSYEDFPGYGVASEFYAIANMMMLRQQKSGNGGFTTEGPNAGIRMSMYAAIGGVEDRVGAGADAVLGQRISAARKEPANRTVAQRIRGQQAPQGSDRVIGQLVGGAQIDTLPDRLLGAYRQGKWIARGWDSFDNGGYEGRDVSMAAGTLDSEDPAVDMDNIAKRVEVSVEGFASNWYRDPAVITLNLAMEPSLSTLQMRVGNDFRRSY